MNVLIFADVHLGAGPAGKETQESFVRFLRSIDPERYTQIVILGDLFDFWFEYKHVIFSAYFDVLRALADLRDAGVRIDLVCGNHDFWAGRFLEDELGIRVHRDRYDITLAGRRVRFVHGDGVNRGDYGYRIYKYMARAPAVVALFRLLHPDWAMGLARGISHGSRTLRTRSDPSDSSEVRAVEGYAQGIADRGEADVIVCGHTHFSVHKELTGAAGTTLYINTGDWMENRCYTTWDGTGFQSFRAEQDGPMLEAEEGAGHGLVKEIPREKPHETRAAGE